MSRFVQVGWSMTSPASKTERKEIGLDPYVGENGYVQNAGFVIEPIPELEKGYIKGPRAVVLHRTDSSSATGTLQSFRSHGVGTHFLIDKAGAIYQTASLLKKTSHIGKIRSRCEDEGNCQGDEMRRVKAMTVSAKYEHEKVKTYPARYPMNEDSVGIEVVAKNNGGDYLWDAATPEQRQSIRVLVGFLKNEYRLTDYDVYEHDRISYKTAGEGAGMYDGGAIGGLRAPPSFPDYDPD